ncbi:GAF domain-containing protein [Dactylosporangium sp. NPDC050688]|uniref:GAF domain-containing protein n=1 Tax=Dactylosporangium sp. NPDC050688 TaxID=3157217 RepID=UPI0033C4B5FD
MTGDGVHGMAVASDPRTARIEELQFTLGEGPCIDAFASGRPVLVSDLAGEATSRWPMYTPAGRDAGVRAVFAFPLQIGAARLGVLDVFRARPGSLSRAELGQAFTFADLMVVTLLDGQEWAGAGEFDEMFEHRAELFQAQGMVMIQWASPSAMPWCGCGPTPTPRIGRWARWPRTSSPAACGSTPTTHDHRDDDRRKAGTPS